MILIYWKNKVGSAIAALCEYASIAYDMRDDSDGVISFEKYESIIPSPGVPATHPIYQTWKIVSELDFAYQFLPKGFQIVSITGTDGKSTTTWMMYNILQKEFGVKKGVYISGNFEIPFSATILDILRKWEKRGMIVVEVSSFMAYRIKNYQSDYSIFTNFKPDHLNWHRDLQEYLDAKIHVTRNTKNQSIINQQVIDFARDHHLRFDLPENTRIFQWSPWIAKDRTNGEEIIISGRRKYRLSETHFSGQHNAMNLLSVGLVANAM